tara:strand:- start:149 stop:649 length:501 start_codon:yes stop_codon:yes gene_type:complete
MKKVSRSILILTSAFIISACSGTVNISPATMKNIDAAETYDAPYEKAWLAAVDWFAEQNIIIDKIEKASGLITARYNLQISPDSLDCGKVEASTMATILAYEEFASINVTVRSVDENKTKIRMNISGNYKGIGHDTGWGKSLPFSGTCYSTGVFEKDFSNYIQTRL